MIRSMLGLLAALMFSASVYAQASSQDEAIAQRIAAQVLTEQILSDRAITIDAETRQLLAAAGISDQRFTLGETLIIDAQQPAGQPRALTFGVSYLEQTGRRLWVVIRAWYEATPGTARVTRAEFFWNSPPEPDVQLRLVPHGRIATNQPPADSYTQSVERMNEVIGVTIEPNATGGQPVDLSLIFIDRVAFDARIEFTLARSGDGAAFKVLDASRIDATGWPSFIIDGSQLEPGFLQVRYRPGNDHDQGQAQSTIIAAYDMMGPTEMPGRK